MGAWNWVDWVLAIIIVLSIVPAVRKGFVRELISLAAVVIGLVLAALEYPRAAGWYEDLTKSHEIALAAGFLTLFVAVLVAGAVISAAAHLLVRTAGVEWFDRFLGGIFGFIRGVIIDAILLMILMAFAIKPAAVSRSYLAPYISTGARAIAVVMPQNLKDHFYSGFEKFRQAIMESTQRGASSKGSSL
ncbi:MAG TPA: CvpA family protein [Terriglobia bacterium]|nr:CvpA family protein [Terriglobia bacterium]